MSQLCRGRPVRQIPILFGRKLTSLWRGRGAKATQVEGIMSETIARSVEGERYDGEAADEVAARTGSPRGAEPRRAAAAFHTRLSHVGIGRMMPA